MPIEMKPVTSSHVDAIGYDAPNRKLVVSYRGRRAVYAGVPPDVAEAVIDSPNTTGSVGKAINLWIRGKYDFAYEDERNAGRSASGSTSAGEVASE